MAASGVSERDGEKIESRPLLHHGGGFQGDDEVSDNETSRVSAGGREEDVSTSNHVTEDGDQKARLPAPPGKSNPRHHVMNMVMLSVCFFFTFTAFTALQNLQASLNKEGKVCLAVLYGGLVASCFLTPPLVQRLSPKVTVALCMVVHCVFTAANYYPNEYVLVPVCGLLGLASAPLWTAQQTYLTSSAHFYAAASSSVATAKVDVTSDDAINRFNGIFFFIFQATQVAGNLISSLVLHQSRHTAGDGNTGNETACHHNDTGNSSSLAVSDSVRYTLLSVYLTCNVAGVVLCLLRLRPLATSVSQYVARDWKSTCLATLRRMLDPYMLLLIPVVTYSGMEQAYIFGEFTKHFITDCLGIGWVGYVMLLFGVLDAASSIACSKMASRLGRVPIVVTGALVNAGLIIFLLIWVRVPSLLVVFVVAALWGFVDAVWNTQLSTLFGVLFSADQEAAFANYRLWQSIGWCISFAYGGVFEMSVKLWILVSILATSTLLYLVAELQHFRQKSK